MSYYMVVDIDRVIAGKVSPGGYGAERVDEQTHSRRHAVLADWPEGPKLNSEGATPERHTCAGNMAR